MMEAGGPSLCPVCELFGSTIKAGKLKISDAALLNDSEPVRRDGVGIDRDTGRAVDRIKYDFEALGRGCHFQCRIQLENAEDDDLALLFILLKEWEIGIDAGGRKARGLGRLKLKSYQVEWFVDLASYLSDNTANSEPDRFVAELREAFNRFINLQGGAGAKKTDQ
jgi:CRISPR/Cas system CSM-associated protein Csm3 (group 7 of RAMP superfamily)